MKIVQINSVCGAGSTGRICVSVSNLLNEKQIENRILYSTGYSNFSNGIKISRNIYIKFQAFFSRILGNYGFNSYFATRKILKELNSFKPDIVHLHNMHSHNCNMSMLLNYLRKKRIKVFWTFHDCWAFTAYCPHFTMAKCDKWKYECFKCPLYRNYSWLFDRSNYLYKKKKKCMSGLNLTIITPSQWLANLVKQSFLKDYPVQVINNGIDLSIFKPSKGDFRERYHLDCKKIVLGVALAWGTSKGLDVFVQLSKRLPRDYQIVLIGTNKIIDKLLPHNIISIHRTQNQQELAEIYTAANVFVNPTREENYPTVNMESLACGTPVVTFKTGGSPEILNKMCGVVVDCDDVDAMETEILNICEKNVFSVEACLEHAKTFDMNDRFNQYILLYENK